MRGRLPVAGIFAAAGAAIGLLVAAAIGGGLWWPIGLAFSGAGMAFVPLLRRY